MSAGDLERWAATWQRAGRALAEIEAAELAALTDEEAAVAAIDLLSLAESLPPKAAMSGLVEQQRLFRRVA